MRLCFLVFVLLYMGYNPKVASLRTHIFFLLSYIFPDKSKYSYNQIKNEHKNNQTKNCSKYCIYKTLIVITLITVVKFPITIFTYFSRE